MARAAGCVVKTLATHGTKHASMNTAYFSMLLSVDPGLVERIQYE